MSPFESASVAGRAELVVAEDDDWLRYFGIVPVSASTEGGPWVQSFGRPRDGRRTAGRCARASAHSPVTLPDVLTRDADREGLPAGLPRTGRDQSCALCGSTGVVWVHPLAPDRVRYRVYGKGQTLPTFWTVCASCESLVAEGSDDELVDEMKTSDGWPWTTEDDVREVLSQALEVFRRADLGAHPLDY